MKFCIALLACTAISFFSFSQAIPKNPNVTDARGLRQGKWTLLFDVDWNPVESKDSVVNFRVIEYSNDKPVGIVRDYYATGNLQWEGRLLVDRPEEVKDGITTFYFENGKTDAVETYLKGRKINEVSYNLDGSKTPERWLTVYNRAKKAHQASKYDSAKILYEKAIIFAEKKYGKNDRRFINSKEALGNFYFSRSDFKNAIELYEEVLAWRKSNLSENHKDYISSLKNTGMAYQRIGSYDRALDYLYHALNSFRNTKGEKSQAYADLLNDIGLTYTLNGKYEKADSIQQRVLALRELILGKSHKDYAQSLNNLAFIYYLQGHYGKSSSFIQQSLDIREKVVGKNSGEYVGGLNNLATLYTLEGNYTKAIALFEQAMQISEKLSGIDTPDYAHIMHNLATLYQLRGQYVKAESFFLQVLDSRRKTIGENSPFYAETLYELANVYMLQGNYIRAERLHRQALDIRAKTLGKDHTAYGESLLKLAMMLSEKAAYKEAERLYLESLEAIGKTSGKEHVSYALTLNYLAALYFKQGFSAKAEPLFQQVAAIRGKVSPTHHGNASVKNDLAILYEFQCDIAKAEVLYNESLAIDEKSLDKDDPERAIILSNLGRFYLNINHLAKAEPFFIGAIQNQLKQIENYFPAMSESEKEVFFKTLQRNFEIFNSFAVRRKDKNPAILSEMYNNQLSTKALLFNTNTKIRNKVLSSKDSVLIGIYSTWLGKKDILAKAYQMNSDLRTKKNINLIAMEDEINALEKEISSKAGIFGSARERKIFTWKDVQKTLKKAEASVELIRFRKYGVIRYMTDSSQVSHPRYAKRGLTDTIYYAALIVTPQAKLPELILLKNGEELEGKYIKLYKNSIQFKLADTTSYDQFWRPVAEALKTQKVTKVYLSPDGVYNSINLSTLQNTKTQKFVSDEIEVQVVTNTKDLVAQSMDNRRNDNNHASLFGYPDYLKSDTTIEEFDNDRSLFKTPVDSIQRAFAGGTINRLPGTQKEVISINALLASNLIQTSLYTDRLATEDELKKVSKPAILHIATHGFFLKDVSSSGEQDFAGFNREKIAENPLLRSGLLMAGSQKALDGTLNNDSEDGILTSYEAMNLDLDDTDLVVLSACETGLGEIRNGEGVYGLQRAFQTAGAKSILMSLWKVDDNATQELMTAFYKNWLKSGDKRGAFKQAQKIVRKKYPHPYYWGAFVLVGE